MSARRQARAAAPATPADGMPPAVLYDRQAATWQDRDLFVAWMRENGWADSLPARDRISTGGHPANRRNAAADSWARENGVTTPGGTFADWTALRAMSLID